MQWLTIINYCFEHEAASGQAGEAVADREPESQRRRRRGALPSAGATSATRLRAEAQLSFSSWRHFAMSRLQARRSAAALAVSRRLAAGRRYLALWIQRTRRRAGAREPAAPGATWDRSGSRPVSLSWDASRGTFSFRLTLYAVGDARA